MKWRIALLLLGACLMLECCTTSPQLSEVPPVNSATATPSVAVDLSSHGPADDAAVMSDTPIDVTGIPKEKLHQYEGRLVEVRGKFSLYGVVGPFVIIPDGAIYIEPEGSFSWGDEYGRIEGRQTTVTGVLHFRRYKRSNEQHPPDHFYFWAETARVKLK
jgi:hypothetical protein